MVISGRSHKTAYPFLYKPGFSVFSTRTKVLDKRILSCYYEVTFFIWQKRLSRKSSQKGCHRELPVGARQWLRIWWSSFCELCVEGFSRHNGCDRYIAKAFQAWEGSVRKGGSKQSGTAYFTSLFIGGVFYLPFSFRVAKSMRHIPWGICKAEW